MKTGLDVWIEAAQNRNEDTMRKEIKQHQANIKYSNGKPMFSSDGMMLDDKGNRSIFDDLAD